MHAHTVRTHDPTKEKVVVEEEEEEEEGGSSWRRRWSERRPAIGNKMLTSDPIGTKKLLCHFPHFYNN